MSTTLKTHGLDGTLEDPAWVPLSMSEVHTLLSAFPDCGRVLDIEFVSPRPFSAACVVSTDAGRVFVKRHSARVRERSGLLEEHCFLEHLHAHGAPVPRILHDADGRTAIESADWTYEVHEAASGADIYGDAQSWTPFQSAEHAHSAGEALARLHLAAESFKASSRGVRPLLASFTIFADAQPDSALRRYLAARPVLLAHAGVGVCARKALALLAPYHAELLPLLPAIRPLWTHNDLHASNLIWSDFTATARATSVIDFGLCDKTNAVHDLAHAIERNIVEWLVLVNDPYRPQNVPVHLDHLLALLDGYEQVRPLSAEEAAALAPMVALCHAEFALSEVDYFLDVLDSEEKARMAYDGWLLGHARWFRSSAGEMLLDALRRWASARTTAQVTP